MGKTKILVWFGAVVTFILFALNLLGVFVPEVGYDALWYHLTLPKLWLMKGEYHIPGGLLYYSVMPRLTEWIYTPLIHFTGTAGPKMVQFLSSAGICYLIYLLGRKFKLSKTLSFFATFVYYCSFLVSWQSSSAYIDLFRSLLEITAFYFFIKDRYILGGLFLGLALGTKWLILFSVFIYALVFGFKFLPVTFLVSLPWFIIAFYFTGNPVYPLFSSILQNGFQPIWGMVKNIVLSPIMFTFPFDDFISPIAGVFFSLAAVSCLLLTGIQRKAAYVAILGGLGTLVLDPPSARFFLPYYPLSILVGFLLVQKLEIKLQQIFLFICLVSCVLVLGLRLFTFGKNVDYLMGKQTREEYLGSLSGRLKDTFVDTDGYVKDNLKDKKILIDKLHNLYYFPYDFDHTSWASKITDYNYLVTINQDPKEINGKLVHTNSMGIQVFELFK